MHAPAAALLLTLASLAAAQDKCYYPEGNEATDFTYTPCAGVNTTFSQCCLLDQGDRCLPNGLCYYGQKNYDYRSACSDKSWETCADPCPNCELPPLFLFLSLTYRSCASSVAGPWGRRGDSGVWCRMAC